MSGLLHLVDIAALDGAQVACPVCGPSRSTVQKRNKKVLRIWHVEPGFATYYCARCGLKGYSRDGSRRASPRSLGHHLVAQAHREQRKHEESDDRTRRTGIAERIMASTVPATDRPAQRYLEGRCIILPVPMAIRLSAAVWHPCDRRELPAMVSRIEHPITGALLGVHITFLQPDGSGKAEVIPAKIMRGIARGGIVRLAEPADTLALSEGIESALSFMQLSGITTWAALSAGNLCNISLPPTVQEVVLAADNDERGLDEARKAGHRWRLEGRQVLIVRPAFAGQDWNDVLYGGANG